MTSPHGMFLPQAGQHVFDSNGASYWSKKSCKQCGKEFMGIKRKEYCSRACVEKAAYHRNLEAYRESRMRSYRKAQEEAEKKTAGKK